MYWAYLLVAIIAEVIATSALKATAGFTRLGPVVLVAFGYGAAFYCLSLALAGIPLGVAYAVWSGVGLACISLLGWLLYGQVLDTAALIGTALIVLGVLVIHLFSKASGN